MVAVAGITAYRTAFGERKATMGRQPTDLAGGGCGWCRTPAASTPTDGRHPRAGVCRARPRRRRAPLTDPLPYPPLRPASTTITSARSTSSSASSTRARGSPARRWSSSGHPRRRARAGARRSSARASRPRPVTSRSRRAPRRCSSSPARALQLGHNYIGTEHILLGLIREGEGVAAQVLVKLGADLAVRQQVIQLLSGYQGGKEAAGATDGPRRPRPGARPRVRWSWTSSAATSRSPPARASSTRSSGVRRRSSGSCRCCPAAPRTTRC